MEVKNNESIEMLEETTLKVKKKHVTFVEPSPNRNNNNNNTSYKRFVI
jgi:hypothetical protein